MSITDPYYLWTISGAQRDGEIFSDVDISEDGKKVVVAGSMVNYRSYVILWVLDATNGNNISQSEVKVSGTSMIR